MTGIAAYLDTSRVLVEAALGRVLPGPPGCPDVVAKAMQYSLMAGGKRLRPILCLASAEAVGGDRLMALPAACAIELIHTYSLIHDDLPAMDDDTMRRGRPTLHVVAGEGMAILAGDGLLTEAFHLLAREPASRDPQIVARKIRVIDTIAAAAGPEGMVGGQAIDLASVTVDSATGQAPLLDAKALRWMHGMKTGALIRASAASGAIMGGGSDDEIAAVDGAAAEFGLAFQIVDDILDVEGASAHLGKTAGKDAAAGKPTYPGLYGLEASRRMAAECLDRAAATLRSAGIADDRLLAIGTWIVERSK
ncbi:MAG TPA: farnesyl diphosphate synthase [Vicinamibacterales bacterium]|nr:farnesyl diphosphate synthase [Vicinamibacterales bacterium]